MTPEAVVARLAAAGCVAADLEAAELVGSARDSETLARWVRRREQGEPLAWITGTVEHHGRPVRTAPGVYVPRLQTEALAARAAALLPPNGRALDLCTGTGAIAVHLMAAVPSATVIGIDIDRAAAACARSNGVLVVAADLATSIAPATTFDVITAVAPYVPTTHLALLPADVQRYEPAAALDGGRDGLDVVRRVVEAAAELLRSGGWLLVEIGGDQDRAVVELLSLAGFDEITVWRDDDGEVRGVVARRR